MFEWNCSRMAMKCPMNAEPNSPPNKRVTWNKHANVSTSTDRDNAPVSITSSTIDTTIELKASANPTAITAWDMLKSGPAHTEVTRELSRQAIPTREKPTVRISRGST